MNLGLGRVGRIGRDEEQAEHGVDDRDAPAFREQRVYLARHKSHWQELEETSLVPRGPWLVHAASDRLFAFHRGSTFVGGRLEFDRERTDVAFYVDRDGEGAVAGFIGAVITDLHEAKPEPKPTVRVDTPAPIRRTQSRHERDLDELHRRIAAAGDDADVEAIIVSMKLEKSGRWRHAV